VIQPWLTPEQVADYYQLPIKTVWKKIRRGEIKAKNFGTDRCHRYRVSAVEIRRLDAA
jgi:excisionase family DNA binding protein